MNNPIVVAVSLSAEHTFSKQTQPMIHLLEGLGVEGDTHAGATVQHRSRIKRDPTKPNLRQVHLIHAELHEELRKVGFNVQPGQMGENITTQDINLLALPTGTRLHIGRDAVVQVTGLRNPCNQLNDFQAGLMDAVLERDGKESLIRKAGIMGVVRAGGDVYTNDPIQVELPSPPYAPLKVV